MTPGARARGLAAAAQERRDTLLGLAEAILGSRPVAVVDPSTPGSVMLELEGPGGTFCLAEVVVTEARVSVNGSLGWGSVMGFDEAAALAAAVLDAAATADNEMARTVETLCADALDRNRSQRSREAAELAATEVTPG